MICSKTEVLRGDSGIDAVCQFNIFFLVSLDNGRGVNAGRSAKRVFAHDWIVRRNRNTRGDGNFFAIFFQFGQVLLVPGRNTHQLQVDQHLIHLRVADTLSDAEGGGMDTIRARNQSRHSVRGGEAAVAVSVPVDANLLARRLHHLFQHELHQRHRAHGSRVSGGVAQH